jgi:steroid delta-isomerase-like uncharacterized protein
VPESIDDPGGFGRPAWAGAYGRAWSGADGAHLAAFFAEEAVYEDTGTGACARGRTEIAAYHAFMRAFAPDSLIVFAQTLGDAERFALEWTWSGTATGPIRLDSLLHPATGRSFSVPGVAVCAADEAGLLTLHRDIYDMRATLRSCGIGSAEVAAAEGAADAQALVRRVYAALRTGDAPALREVLAADFEGVFADGLPHELGGTRRGPDAAITEGWWAIGRHFRVFAEPQRWIAGESGRLLVTGRYRGTARAGGGEVDADFAHLWTARDGRLVALHQFTDTARWAAALAVAP